MPRTCWVGVIAATGGGARIGYPREDIAVEVADFSYEEQERARREAEAQYRARHRVVEVMCLGGFSNRFEYGE